MFKLTCKIEVVGNKSWTFDKVVQVEIERNTETLTDTCTITLPRKVKWQGETAIPLKRGDKIVVALGYNGENVVAFRGYITTIGAKTPIVIKCEDEMFALKTKTAVKKAYKSVDIETLLRDQQLGLPIKVLGKQNIGTYRQDCDTVAAILNNLKEQGVRSFFKYDASGQATLYCGVIFGEHGSRRVQTFDNHINIISDADLNVQKSADVKLRVKAVSLDANNKKTVVEVGDADGEVRTLHKYAVSAKELKDWAEQELQRLKRDGLVGSFDTFGHVLVDKLDTIAIVLDGAKMGVYQVEKNVITYGASGFRQNITLGARVDD